MRRVMIWMLKGMRVMIVFFFQPKAAIRVFCLPRGLGNVYKRQLLMFNFPHSNFQIFFMTCFSPVSYTQLTLPTKGIAEDLAGRLAFKKKNSTSTVSAKVLDLIILGCPSAADTVNAPRAYLSSSF
ncbi:hypothetical protein HGQ71_14255, partial [Staphylococcus aureus]|nr:hypothetical protein [Staphylococcus aureus]